MNAYRDFNNALASAGRKEYARGYAIGYAQGYAKGCAEVMVEASKSMLADGYPMQDIIKLTGIDEESAKRLAASHGGDNLLSEKLEKNIVKRMAAKQLQARQHEQ